MKKIIKRIYNIKHMPDDVKIIYLYRYISLAITSLFYLITNTQSSLQNKLIMILCLGVSSVILNYLYFTDDTGKKIIKLLIFIETIVNTIILIPTGGINSLFIWYSLNTICISIYFINIYYCVINLIFYLIISSEISVLIFNREKDGLIQVLINNSNLILSFVLITTAIYMLFKLEKKVNKEREALQAVNEQLASTNERLNESMEKTIELYQTVYSFVNIKNADKVVKILIEHAKKITKASNVFFFDPSSYDKLPIIFNTDASEQSKLIISKIINNNWDLMKDSSSPVCISENRYDFIAVTVKSSNEIYGILGVQVEATKDKILKKECIKKLRFLASLSSIIFEKNELEQVNEKLVISQEQNRIANEIHDSVSQRLFAAACGIHTLMKKLIKNQSLEAIDDLEIIRDSIDNSIKELRETIYKLSWRKKGESVFKQNMQNFIEDISKLNNVIILFDLQGEEEFIDNNIKKALYRIACESIGNSIRHGKSSKVDLLIDVERDYTHLRTIDDGIGFVINDKDGGLGITNMSNLVYLFNGKIEIRSNLNEGTIVDVLLPNNVVSSQEEVV